MTARDKGIEVSGWDGGMPVHEGDGDAKDDVVAQLQRSREKLSPTLSTEPYSCEKAFCLFLVPR